MLQPLHIPYLDGLDAQLDPPALTALLDDKGARADIRCVNWPEKFAYRPLSSFSIAHNGTHLFIDFFTRCNSLRAVNTANQSPVSEDSCVEFFVSPDPASRRYWNFEFNCIGAVNASTRIERPAPRRLDDTEIATIVRHGSCGTRPFDERSGMFAWNLLVAIPLELIGVKFEGTPLTMRANFYKCGSATGAPHLLSWAPIYSDKPNFHTPEFFGTIILSSPDHEV